MWLKQQFSPILEMKMSSCDGTGKIFSIVRIKFYCKECKIRHAFSAEAKCLETKSMFM